MTDSSTTRAVSVVSPPAPILALVECLLPMSAAWVAAPLDGAPHRWRLTTGKDVIDVDLLEDVAAVTIAVGGHLLLTARAATHGIAALTPWLHAAIGAQRANRGHWVWARSKRTTPWVMDRDAIWDRLSRGVRLGTGIRGRCFTDFFMEAGTLTRFDFDEGFSETRASDERELYDALNDDPRDMVEEHTR